MIDWPTQKQADEYTPSREDGQEDNHEDTRFSEPIYVAKDAQALVHDR